jgi:protein-disulfide isomerase
VEFSDFQCPYCGQLAATLKRIEKEYPTAVRVTFKQFPLPMHPQAAMAAEASLCAADQGRFWEMQDILFANQNLLSDSQMNVLAARAGVETREFERCLGNHLFRDAVSQDRAEAASLGLNGTPTLFINGRLSAGARPYEVLREMVEEELKRH